MAQKKQRMRRLDQKKRVCRMISENQIGEILSRTARGEGKKKIAKAMGVSKNTVARYLKMNSEQVVQARCRQRANRHSGLDGLKEFLEKTFSEVEGNCQNLQEVLEAQKGLGRA